MNLREVVDRDGALGRIAAWRPSTTAEAYTTWLSDRRRTLAAGIDTVDALAARKRGHQITTLGVIAEKLSARLKCKISVEKQLVLRRPAKEGQSKDDEIDALKGLLCPSTPVAQAVLGELTTLYDLAEGGIIKGDDIERWQGFMTEVRQLRTVVENCDSGGVVVTPAPERVRHARRARPITAA